MIYFLRLSTERQPIEALFNWLIQKADIQMAGKVRSINGLYVHAYGRIATVYINLLF